jgi:hypothetical protein
MKRQLGAAMAAIVIMLSVGSVANAQTALFIYDDHAGVPNAGTYTPGSSFTFDISLTFAPGGSVANLAGLSYWFQQINPSLAPFPFSISLRDATGSPFTFLQTPGLTYPQNLNPSNANDLGASTQSGTGVNAGTYFIATITVSIPLNAPTTGTFTLSNTLTGGKTSIITDDLGHTFAIPEADYVVTMVPEPATWLTPTLGVLALLFAQRRNVLRLCRRVA